MGKLFFQPQNAHRVQVEGREMLFHVPTTALFELDSVEGDVLQLFADRQELTASDVQSHFQNADPGTDPGKVSESIKGLMTLDIVTGPDGPQPDRPTAKIEGFPLSTIVLNVNTGCNLACTYCYKEDLDTPVNGRKMAFDTAVKSIDMLLAESPDRDEYNIVFFGGEPLSNLPLVRSVVEHAEERFAKLGKQVHFTMTTNATLLTEDLVDWLDTHRFGLTISMDGPKALHDKNRVTVGGKGTYDVVAAKTRMLLARYTSRPVGARVTLTAGITQVAEIFDHLKHDLGFAEVGVAPVTSGDMAVFNLSGDELSEVFEGMKHLGRAYRDAALEGRSLGFSNIQNLMDDLHEGRAKALPCGAGLGLLAVDHAGEVNLCHRFTGSDMDTFGHVDTGLKHSELKGFLSERLDRSGKGCDTCRIRNICAGGCYHESYAQFSDPLKPAYHYCDLMRDWVDFGIEIYSEIRAKRPNFFEKPSLKQSQQARRAELP